MRFVNEKTKNETVKNHSTEDQLGVTETKQPEVVKDDWRDAVTTTLVNLRSGPSVNEKTLDQIRGGEIVKMNVAKRESGFAPVKYGSSSGFVSLTYLRMV